MFYGDALYKSTFLLTYLLSYLLTVVWRTDRQHTPHYAYTRCAVILWRWCTGQWGSVVTARRVCIARTMPWQDVCLSVCPSVRHTPVLYLNDYTYHQSFFQKRYQIELYIQWWIVYGLLNGAISNDLERPLPPVSRSRHSLTLNVSETVRDTDIVSMKY